MLNSHNKTIFETLGRNPIHPFPARMAPGIALEALSKSKAPLRVLDPMVGSGTVLAVARAKGHRAYGLDLDPLSVLLADVWTRTVETERVKKKAMQVLDRAREAFSLLTSRHAYPAGSDAETRKFIRYWFDEYGRRQLAALSAAIRRVHDKVTRDVLWCAFSRLIITKSSGASLAMDLSHSRPHKVFQRAPIKPFNRFAAAVEVVITNCPRAGMRPLGPAAVVKQGDARKLAIADESIDLVLTSPPYLNAIDYMRCSKFSLVWMGYNISNLRKIRGESIGTGTSSEEATQSDWVKALIQELRLEPWLSRQHHSMLAQYVWDMNHSLAEVSRVLRFGGRAVYIVGDSTVRGTFIRNSAIVTAVAQKHKLSMASRQSRSLPPNRRYLPPPNRISSNAAMSNRIRREVVLVFDKLSV